MARNPKRDQALEIWRDSKGMIALTTISEKVGVPVGTIRAWKNRDNWNATLHSEFCNVADKKVQRCKKEPKKIGGQPGNKNAEGSHGEGNKNAEGNNGGAPPENQNAVTHGYYSKYIPVGDLEMLQEAPGAGKLELALQLANYKLARLLRCQQNKWMHGVGFNSLGADVYKLQDDFYEPLIQKQIKLIADLEFKIHKMKQSGIDNKDEPIQITIKRKEKRT